MVGEVRQEECLNLLLALISGFDGMSTVGDPDMGVRDCYRPRNSSPSWVSFCSRGAELAQCSSWRSAQTSSPDLRQQPASRRAAGAESQRLGLPVVTPQDALWCNDLKDRRPAHCHHAG